jgi:hypothetical protein
MSTSAPIPRPIKKTARKSSPDAAPVRNKAIPQAAAPNKHIATRGAKKRSNKYPDPTLPIRRALPRNEVAKGHAVRRDSLVAEQRNEMQHTPVDAGTD